MKMIRPSQFTIRDKFQRNDSGFEIVAGHRRFQACRTLRWRFIPAKIRELSDKQAYEIQLTENIQRKSMDPIEEYVSHHMQLLKLPDEIKDKIVNNSLKVSQAIEIVQIPHEKQQNIASEVINNNLTVRQIRELKMALRDEEQFDNPVISAKNQSRSSAIAKKASLTLKITLARVDNLINEVHTTIEPDQRAEIINFLMGIRLTIHSLIDESIRFKNKKCDS